MVGERLKELRAARKLTQGAVCKALNIEQPTLANYESGARQPNLKTLMRLAEYFNVSTDYLLGIDKTPYSPEAFKYIDQIQQDSSFEITASPEELEKIFLHWWRMYRKTGRSENEFGSFEQFFPDVIEKSDSSKKEDGEEFAYMELLSHDQKCELKGYAKRMLEEATSDKSVAADDVPPEIAAK